MSKRKHLFLVSSITRDGDNSFAVRRQVPSIEKTVTPQTRLRPGAGLKGIERISLGDVTDHNQTLVVAGKEELVPLLGPDWKVAATGRNLPKAPGAWERPHINLTGSRVL